MYFGLKVKMIIVLVVLGIFLGMICCIYVIVFKIKNIGVMVMMFDFWEVVSLEIR